MAFLSLMLCLATTVAASPTVELQPDEASKKLSVVVDGRPAVVYQYGDEFALPHLWPIHSPSGKLLTDQHPDPFPHHRSLWIADRLKAGDGPEVDFYHCWKNQRDAKDPAAGFHHFIRHQRFGQTKSDGATATVESELRWIVNDDQPVLDDHREMRVVALGNGEYLLDLKWTLTALEDDVKFLSDAVHYAWPYVRIHPQFSGDQGGVITNDRGQKGQAETNGKVASWIDYSNTVDGETEGMTLFLYPDDQSHSWLTREYGTFGPRRAEKYSGSKFTLKSGESLHGRVGILVHRGDVESGRIAERYQQYTEDKL